MIILSVSQKCVLLHSISNIHDMKRVAFCGAFIVSMLMISCDYWGQYSFTIENETNQNVIVSYCEQLRSTEDVLPTHEHRDYDHWGYWLGKPTVDTLEPHATFERVYDIGQVNKNWPGEEDTPESWRVIPLWNRINYIVVGTDTLDPAEYAKGKWRTENRSSFTLTIR